MIDSNASQAEFARAQVAAGPEPIGSKVTPRERVHLLIMVATLVDAMLGGDHAAEQRAAQALGAALSGRGLRSHHIADTFRDHMPAEGPVVTLANAFATHPRMREAS